MTADEIVSVTDILAAAIRQGVDRGTIMAKILHEFQPDQAYILYIAVSRMVAAE